MTYLDTYIIKLLEATTVVSDRLVRMITQTKILSIFLLSYHRSLTHCGCHVFCTMCVGIVKRTNILILIKIYVHMIAADDFVMTRLNMWILDVYLFCLNPGYRLGSNSIIITVFV